MSSDDKKGGLAVIIGAGPKPKGDAPEPDGDEPENYEVSEGMVAAARAALATDSPEEFARAICSIIDAHTARRDEA